ncbi:MAG: hypothetical protein JSW06_09420 [Thermoplasmatales archaeon]|nr:MAG: hypothetical protein JSW06_09420 [Thermoplasmatales archaeon]
MKKKLLGIFVCMLLIATAIPAVGTVNELKEGQNAPAFVKNQEVVKGNIRPLHDPVVEWERFYGGGVNLEIFRYVKQTDDGGYIAVGAWNATDYPSGSHWLVKVDANGDEEWNVTACPNSSLYPRCYIVEQTSDGGYITAGCHEDGIAWGYDRCIWKVDEDGNTEWLKIYDDPSLGYHTCIQETTDGGFIVTGEVYYDNSTVDWDVLLMKTDSTGNVEWQKIHRYSEYGDNAYAVRQTPIDGGYILCGRMATGPGSQDADLLVIKTDSNGNILWDNTYGGELWEWCQSNDILLASDGGYYFLGETSSFGAGSRDIWLIKTDADGNMEWNKTYGGTGWEMSGAMDFTDDDGIIISGTLNNGHFMPPSGEGLVIKTDLDGVLEWGLTFGDEQNDQLQGACFTNDGGYIVAGNFVDTSPSGVGMEGCLIKINAFENNPPDKPDKPSGKKKQSPGVVYTYTSKASDIDGDQIYYMWDWADGNKSEWLGPYNSGEICEAEYHWEEGGEYNVKVMAMDEHYAESEWSEGLSFSILRNKAFNFNFNLLEWLFERFPNAFPILRQLLGT